MVNGAFNFLARARYLGLERVDALGQFRNRERVEILARKLCDQVAGAAGKAVVGFHRAIVDAGEAGVNKRRRRRATNGGEA